jgi:hypothetical protein
MYDAQRPRGGAVGGARLTANWTDRYDPRSIMTSTIRSRGRRAYRDRRDTRLTSL